MPELTYTSEDILISIRNNGMIPDTKATGSEDADLLRHASEGIQSYIFAAINQLREQYYYWISREALVSGTATYKIPARAQFNKLAGLWIVQGNDRIGLDPLDPESLDRYSLSGTNSVPFGYTINGNWIRLHPDNSPSLSGSLEWRYYVRPGNLVKSTEYRTVASVDSTTAITLDSAAPASWSTSNTFDIHSKHSGCDYKSISLSTSTTPSTTITFDQLIDGSVFGTHPVEVGDYVCLENTVAKPGVPPELFPQVARLAAMHWAESTGNSGKFNMHAKVVEGFLRETLGSMEQRVEEQPIRLGTRTSFLDYEGGWYY